MSTRCIQPKATTVCPCYNGPRYNGNLVIPDALTSQSHFAITDKLKFWWSRYSGNLVLHVRYSKGGLYFLRESSVSAILAWHLGILASWHSGLCRSTPQSCNLQAPSFVAFYSLLHLFLWPQLVVIPPRFPSALHLEFAWLACRLQRHHLPHRLLPKSPTSKVSKRKASNDFIVRPEKQTAMVCARRGRWLWRLVRWTAADSHRDHPGYNKNAG